MNEGFNSAILSRCAMSATMTFSLPNPSYRTVAAIATVKGYQIANVHLTTTDEQHLSQVSALLSVLRPSKSVLCGDFNFNLTASAYQAIVGSGYSEAWPDLHPSGMDSTGYRGYTNGEFDSRLDMFFSTSDTSFSSIRVLRHQECAVCQHGREDSNDCLGCSASDHLAVIVNVT